MDDATKTPDVQLEVPGTRQAWIIHVVTVIVVLAMLAFPIADGSVGSWLLWLGVTVLFVAGGIKVAANMRRKFYVRLSRTHWKLEVWSGRDAPEKLERTLPVMAGGTWRLTTKKVDVPGGESTATVWVVELQTPMGFQEVVTMENEERAHGFANTFGAAIEIPKTPDSL